MFMYLHLYIYTNIYLYMYVNFYMYEVIRKISTVLSHLLKISYAIGCNRM